jgi:hypothetical protein
MNLKLLEYENTRLKAKLKKLRINLFKMKIRLLKKFQKEVSSSNLMRNLKLFGNYSILDHACYYDRKLYEETII